MILVQGNSDYAPPLPMPSWNTTRSTRGYASPIVADGMVYVIHYQPSGKVMAEGLPKRFTESLPAESLTIEADDVIVAIDAETGKTRWVSSQGGKGMNYFMDNVAAGG